MQPNLNQTDLFEMFRAVNRNAVRDLKDLLDLGGFILINEPLTLEFKDPNTDMVRIEQITLFEAALQINDYSCLDLLIKNGAKVDFTGYVFETFPQSIQEYISDRWFLFNQYCQDNKDFLNENTRKRERSPSPVAQQKHTHQRVAQDDCAAQTVPSLAGSQKVNKQEEEAPESQVSNKSTSSNSAIIHRPRGAAGRRRPTRKQGRALPEAATVSQNENGSENKPPITHMRSAAMNNPAMALAQLGMAAANARGNLRKRNI